MIYIHKSYGLLSCGTVKRLQAYHCLCVIKAAGPLMLLSKQNKNKNGLKEIFNYLRKKMLI